MIDPAPHRLRLSPALPLWTLALLTVLSSGSPLRAQLVYHATAQSVPAPYHPGGGSAVSSFEVTLAESPSNPGFPTPVAGGFSLAFSVDPAFLRVDSIVPAGPLATVCGGSWDLFQVDLTVEGCPGTATAAAVYGFACDVFFPFEFETPLLEVGVTALAGSFVGASGPVTTLIVGETCAGVAGVVPAVGGDVEPTWIDAPLVFEPGPPVPFIRGDCNSDGGVEIGDAIFLLSALFARGEMPPCLEACDMHDDGGSPDIGDAIHLLTHLFGGGPPPAAPHPGCGAGPDPSAGACLDAPSCP